MRLQNSSCSRALASGMTSDISTAARIRPMCYPVRPLPSTRVVTASQTNPWRSRQLLQTAAVAAPDRAPDAEQAPAEQQQPEPAAAQQPEVSAVADAAEAPAVVYDVPKLADLQLQAIINTKGYVSPQVEPGAAAAVFAVYDNHQKLQYIGFSKDLQASLRTVLGRRPDKAFFFKSVNLATINQDEMLAIRQGWFDECGAPPPGNKLALERKAWQSAVDAGAISARAKPAAAADKLRELLEQLKQRGCVEEFVPDPELMLNGQVDFLGSTEKQQQQPQADGSATAAADADAGAEADSSSSSSSGEGNSANVRTATAVVDGQAKQFAVEYLMNFPTKGGHMFDVKMSFDHMDSQHRIIVGKNYYEPYGIAPEVAVEASLALMLQRKMPRHNEGMLGTAEFPVNYFTVSEMEQWFDEEFAAQFLHSTGHTMTDGSNLFWRMNKIHDYGSKLEDPTSVGAILSSNGLGKM